MGRRRQVRNKPSIPQPLSEEDDPGPVGIPASSSSIGDKKRVVRAFGVDLMHRIHRIMIRFSRIGQRTYDRPQHEVSLHWDGIRNRQTHLHHRLSRREAA
ncbi:MAG: hypothetical protein R3E58_13395 [Phycisphaerae bacterium]